MKSRRVVMHVVYLTLLSLLLPSKQSVALDASGVSTPPPVSGRRLSDPASILPADVLARVELLRANVEFVRRFVGRQPAPAPLLRVESAQSREVYSQALNLELRANRLAFEQVRIVRAASIPQEQALPAAVFGVVDSALAAVLLVKQDLGIGDAVAEEQRPESTTPSEVFNAAVAAGSEINNVLQQQTSPSEVFRLVTGSVHYAAALHAAIRKAPSLPTEPAFVPNMMPSDVYGRMVECFGLAAQAFAAMGIETLEFDPGDELSRRTTPNDVAVLAALLVEELSYLHSRVPQAKRPPHAYYPGVRFPAHVYQRAGLLKQILEDLVAYGLPSGDTGAGR